MLGGLESTTEELILSIKKPELLDEATARLIAALPRVPEYKRPVRTAAQQPVRRLPRQLRKPRALSR